MTDTVVIHDTFAPASGNLSGHSPDVTPGGEAWTGATRWLFGTGLIVPNPAFGGVGGDLEITSPAGAGLYFVEMVWRIIDPQVLDFEFDVQERDTFSSVSAIISLDTSGPGQYRLATPGAGPSAFFSEPSGSTDIVLRMEWDATTGDAHYFINGVDAFGGTPVTTGALATPGTTALRFSLSTAGFPPDGTSALAIHDFKFGTTTGGGGGGGGGPPAGEFWTQFVNTREVA